MNIQPVDTSHIENINLKKDVIDGSLESKDLLSENEIGVEVPTCKIDSVQSAENKKIVTFVNEKFYQEDVNIDKENLKRWGVNELICEIVNPEGLKKLKSFILLNDHMRSKVIEMVNCDKNICSFLEKNPTISDFQKQVLRHMGISLRAIGLPEDSWGKYNHTYQYQFTPPNDEEIDKLYQFLAEELKVAEKVQVLVEDNPSGINCFFDYMESYKNIRAKEDKESFLASEYYENLSTLTINQQYTIRQVILSVGKVINEPREKDVLYTQTCPFIITTKGEILTTSSEIGKGSFKNVYDMISVNSLLLNDDLAMIFINNKEAFEDELEIVKKLTGASPYLSPSFHLIETTMTGGLVAIQEKMRGKSGQDGDGTSLPYEKGSEILKAFAQVALALNAMHEKNIVHGDFKPQNFVFDRKGDARVIDFGHSREIENKQILKVFVGTPGYRAPESVKNNELSKSSDYFSLGVSILETIWIKYLKSDRIEFFKLISRKLPTEILFNLKDVIEKKESDFNEKLMMMGILDISEKLVMINPKERISCEDAFIGIHVLIKEYCPEISNQIVWGEIKKI